MLMVSLKPIHYIDTDTFQPCLFGVWNSMLKSLGGYVQNGLLEILITNLKNTHQITEYCVTWLNLQTPNE